MKPDYNVKTEPFKHQIDACHFAAERFEGFGLFMEQGTGKTKTCIDLVENAFQAGMITACIIIAPNGVHKQWLEEEVPKHGFVDSIGFIWESKEKSAKSLEAYTAHSAETQGKLFYLAINVECFSVFTYLDYFRRFAMANKTFVIVDESTSIKNPQAQRTENILNCFANVTRSGKRILKREPFTVGRAILTGTPTPKGVYGLWSMCEFIRPNFFGCNYYAFMHRYGIERSVQYTGMPRAIRKPLDYSDFKQIRNLQTKQAQEGLVDVDLIAQQMGMSPFDVQYIIDNPQINAPYKNLEELKAKVAEVAFVVKKEDCFDLPAKTYMKRVVPMNEDQTKLTKSLIREAYAIYKDGALDAKNKLSIRVRLHQIAGGFFPTKYAIDDGMEYELDKMASQPIGKVPKFQSLKANLEEGDDFPCIIATAFVYEAEYIAEQLSKEYSVGLITGKVPTGQRSQIEAAFKAGELDILVATGRTIARGYNFQIAHAMHIYSQTEATEDRMQLEDRIHRYGQESDKVVYTDYITENSVDENVMRIVQGDVELQNYMRSSSEDFMSFITNGGKWK